MEAVLDLLGGKWKMLILYHLRVARLRFSELRRLVGNVSEKMLSQQLKEMVADGLLRRIDHQTVPPHVEYETTPFGAELCDTMQPMCEWGARHMAAIEGIAAARAGTTKSA
jgi:DNA-binding HxlR family transcriptional regulator